LVPKIEEAFDSRNLLPSTSALDPKKCNAIFKVLKYSKEDQYHLKLDPFSRVSYLSRKIL
jgi:hypothetical protein